MKRFQSAPPRALAAFAALVMTAATLSASIIAPASVDSARHEVAMSTTHPRPQDYAFVNSGPLTTSIDVVAYRSTRAVTAARTRAASRTDLAG